MTRIITPAFQSSQLFVKSIFILRVIQEMTIKNKGFYNEKGSQQSKVGPSLSPAL
jgi:hypothetical protein